MAKAKKTKKPQVVIAWLDVDVYEDEMNFLCHGGNGPIRIYEKDRLDSRCGKHLPYFDDFYAALDHMEGKGYEGACQLDVSEVESLGVVLG